VKHAAGLIVRAGSEELVTMGPLANPRRATAMAEFTEDAVKHGA
jgi:succinate-semialdehyde dehydrogenase/glutarate-semialdehyde dehydrogenase